MFARQKGATDAEIDVLERYLTRLSSCVDLASAALPGAVAGGGLGWSVAALLGGSLVPGAQYVAESVGLDAAIGWAHVIIVGEGRIDRQTILGKSVADVARRARVTGTMCLAAVGETHLDPMSSEALGLDLVVADPEPDRAGAALASYYSSTLTPERVIP
jgi:glycerate 2-kinase